MPEMQLDAAVAAALRAWDLEGSAPTPLAHGNINKTFLLHTRRGPFVLQRLNAIFDPQIHLDMEAVTAHLSAHGLPTPRLVRTRTGELWLRLEADGSIWRLQTYVAGTTYAQAPSAAVCAQAGELLGRFHACLRTFETPFVAPRLGVHDTARHLKNLEMTLQSHRHHPAYAQVAPLAEQILRDAARLPQLHTQRPWAVHGDPKLANMIFATDGSGALALVDLDTLNRFAVVLELGDALRSWCNPGGEDRRDSALSMPYFAAAMAGYARAAGHLWLPQEIEQLSDATECIALELSARFARDALEEKYFGWEPRKFASASAHHLVRAHSQYQLACSCRAQRAEMVRTLRTTFAGLSL